MAGSAHPGVHRWLSLGGLHAEIYDDELRPGSKILAMGGFEQSHVNLAQPTEIAYEYLARVAHLLDEHHADKTPGAPLSIAHIGAGALTLARYASVKRPGSRQVAVEIERELMDFVFEELPLPAGTDLRLVVNDAAAAFDDELADEVFDVVFVDIFTGWDSPPHLATTDFYQSIKDHLAPDGIMLLNVGDDPPLTFAAQQVAHLESLFGSVYMSTSQDMLTRRYPGNMILMATDVPWSSDVLARVRARGPHPGVVLSGAELDFLK
ncbi:fused MFS/spermidine synthase [Neomicrococcus lactis]|uniref:Spermidine synthase n=1 Tax=Neomicrococcus lactis TaxID=732241 RepID=A0A7W8Y9V2_9MICC|nr:spermidine synthase [Neomicrococcus lactis]